MNDQFQIITDSGADLGQQWLGDNQVFSIPMFCTVDGSEFPCASGESEIKDFYSKLRAGAASKTSALNVTDYLGAWEPYLKDGIDVLHIALSSGISASYSNAFLARRECKDAYPERKVYVVDSLGASLGFGLLVHFARKRQEEGKTLRQVYDWCENNKLNIIHLFTVDDLFHLHRGGRVSSTAATVGTLLSIKPVLDVDVKGALVIRGKVKGRKKALADMVNKMETHGYDPQNEPTIFISHGDCIDEVMHLVKLIQERFGKNPNYIDMIGPVIGSHSGPGTIALFFVGKARE